MDIKGYGKIKTEEILKFENEINFVLPKDYKEFLEKFNGGVPEIKYSNFTLDKLQKK